jgi:hypothetical protein
MYSKQRHDVGLKTANYTQGFMLAIDKELPMYSTVYSKYIIDMYTLSPNSGATNPEYEMHLSQDQFNGGFGQEYMDDETLYHVSNGMDLRNGQGMLSWGSSALSLPTIPTITDAGLEIWTDANTLTNWTFTNRNATLAREATIVDTGTYSARISTANVGGAYGQIHQDMTNYASYKGKTITVTCRCYNQDKAKSKGSLIIDDGVGTTAVNSATSAEWETITVTRTIDASATQFRIIMKSTFISANSYVYFDTVVVPTVGGTTCHSDFNDEMYFSYGTILLKMNSSGTVSIVKAFIADITDLVPFMVSGTDYLFVFLGLSNAYWYMTTAEAFTETTADEKYFQFATRLTSSSAVTMYANDSNNTLRSTTNPLNGGVAWSAQTIVGFDSDDITHLTMWRGVIIIDKEDKPYWINSDGLVVETWAPDAESAKSSHSGKNSTVWQGSYYRPSGDQALMRSGDSITWIQPSRYGTNISDFAGQVEAVVGDEEYLYVITDNSTKVEVLAGRYEVIEGSSVWVYHPINEITLTGCETAWISSVYQKRLYISSTTASEGVKYIPLPTKYGSITTDSNKNFLTGGYFETSWLHGNFRTSNKYAVELTVSMGHTYDADIYFTAAYKLLGDSSWTTIGNFKGSATSMMETKLLAAASVARTSSMIKLKFTGVTDDTTKTPVLLSYDLNTILYPDVRPIIECGIRVADGIVDKNNTKLPSASVLKAVIEEARDSTNPITFYDVWGDTKYCKVLPISPFSSASKNYKGENPEMIYYLRLQEVELT